jgi:hypothetical protein
MRDDEGVRLLVGHDPNMWSTVPRAPEPILLTLGRESVVKRLTGVGCARLRARLASTRRLARQTFGDPAAARCAALNLHQLFVEMDQ